MINIILVEDIADYRQALRVLFNNTQGFCCLADYANAEDCLDDDVFSSADVAMVDLNLPGINGIALIEQLIHKKPELLCMVCTAYEEDEKVFHALSAGAHGYILKSTAPTQILEAVVEVYNGGSPMSSQVARKVVQSFRKQSPPQQYSLTRREEEILDCLAKGLLYKEIAFSMSISIETVRRHCFNIYGKLHVNNRTEALNKYYGK
ncbi:DNA-binding response regulator [Terrimonas sp.]|uniref:response regulator n=1 Tax=Terrimonas sp. TaxID=1914338 RepID=UPI000D51FBA1|nr:response regulator transcription factor [Terrimonas sp.]PVD49473.1 DNA-binding response regulator [Terrimonas sp.]